MRAFDLPRRPQVRGESRAESRRTVGNRWSIAPLEKGSATKVIAVRAPGGHGDVGGHWQNGKVLQQFTLKGMVEYATRAGLKFGNGQLAADSEMAKAINSRYTRALVTADGGAGHMDIFDEMKAPGKWVILSASEYISKVQDRNDDVWESGLRSGQGGSRLNAIRVVGTVTDSIVGPFGYLSPSQRVLGNQPWLDSYPRKMWWIEYELTDLYRNADGSPLDNTKLKEVATWRLVDDGTGGSSWEHYGWVKPE